jgi:C1A family cysteine protease
MRNSWGAGWGMAGYFTLPYAFIKNPTLTSDAWAIQKAE